MRKPLRYAGIAASIVLIAFGIGAVAMGIAGRHTVRTNLAAEKIVGSADMTPKGIRAEAAAAGLKDVSIPSCSAAGRSIDTGSEARCFAQYMRIHALESTGGQVYSQMGRYLDPAGKPTDDPKAAAIDPATKKPVENAARNLWVTETALTTALNTSYFAENVALFSVVMGVALLLTGTGFLVVTLNLPALAGRRRTATGAQPTPGTPALTS